MSVWLHVNGQDFEVEEGSEVHKRLLSEGAAVEVNGPDTTSGGLEDLTVPELRALAVERGLDAPSSAKKADLLELLSEGEEPIDDGDGADGDGDTLAE